MSCGEKAYLMLQSQLRCAEMFISEKLVKYRYHILCSERALNTTAAALNCFHDTT